MKKIGCLDLIMFFFDFCVILVSLFNVLSGEGSVDDYVTLFFAGSIALILGWGLVSEEIRVRKRMRELREEREQKAEE